MIALRSILRCLSELLYPQLGEDELSWLLIRRFGITELHPDVQRALKSQPNPDEYGTRHDHPGVQPVSSGINFWLPTDIRKWEPFHLEEELARIAPSQLELARLRGICSKLGLDAKIVALLSNLASLAFPERLQLLRDVDKNVTEELESITTQGSPNQGSKKHPRKHKQRKGARNPKLEERDKWIYDQCMKGEHYIKILKQLNTIYITKEWANFEYVQNVPDCGRKYALRHGLPPVPPRQDRRDY